MVVVVVVVGRRPNYNEISKGMGKVWADCPSFRAFVHVLKEQYLCHRYDDRRLICLWC